MEGKLLIDGTDVKKYLSDNLSVNFSKSATNEQKFVVKHLKKKQQNKFKEELISTGALGMGAVGLTLLAFSPLLPALIIPGLGFIITSSILRGFEPTKDFIVGYIQQKLALKSEQKNIIENLRHEALNNDDIAAFVDTNRIKVQRAGNRKPSDLSAMQRVKLYYLKDQVRGFKKHAQNHHGLFKTTVNFFKPAKKENTIDNTQSCKIQPH